jgi:hypothetical protein
MGCPCWRPCLDPSRQCILCAPCCPMSRGRDIPCLGLATPLMYTAPLLCALSKVRLSCIPHSCLPGADAMAPQGRRHHGGQRWQMLAVLACGCSQQNAGVPRPAGLLTVSIPRCVRAQRDAECWVATSSVLSQAVPATMSLPHKAKVYRTCGSALRCTRPGLKGFQASCIILEQGQGQGHRTWVTKAHAAVFKKAAKEALVSS